MGERVNMWFSSTDRAQGPRLESAVMDFSPGLDCERLFHKDGEIVANELEML
jgi:hypothetical protein